MNKKVSTKKYTIIFDIDSTSIAGAVVEYAYNSDKQLVQAQEIFGLRKDMSNGQEYSFEDFFKKTLKTFEEVAQKVHLQALFSLDEVYVNLSSPWMSSQKRSIKYTKKNEFIFTKKLADELIQKEIDQPLSKNVDFYNHKVNLFDRHTVGVFANGYPTRNPLGKKMFDLNIQSLTSVISSQTQEAFEHVVERAFHRKPIFLSNTFVAYNALVNTLPDQDDAIIVDISGELTELFVVMSDHLKHISSIPIGVNHLIRDLSQSLSLPFLKARSAMNMHQEGKLEKKYTKNIQSHFKKSFKIWLREFYSMLDSCTAEGLLPSTIILCAPDDLSLWMEEHILESDELKIHFHGNQKISLVHLQDQNMYSSDYLFRDSEIAVLAGFIERNNINNTGKN